MDTKPHRSFGATCLLLMFKFWAYIAVSTLAYAVLVFGFLVCTFSAFIKLGSWPEVLGHLAMASLFAGMLLNLVVEAIRDSAARPGVADAEDIMKRVNVEA